MALIDQLGRHQASLPHLDPSTRSDELEAMRLTVRVRAPVASPTSLPTRSAAAPATRNAAAPATRAASDGAAGTVEPSTRRRPPPAGEPKGAEAARVPAAAPESEKAQDSEKKQEPEGAQGAEKAQGLKKAQGAIGAATRRLLSRLGFGSTSGQADGDDPDADAPTPEEMASRRNWVFGLGAALVVVLLVFFGLQRLVLSAAGTVPDLVGATVQEAREEATEQRWRLNVAEVRRDGTEVNEVVAQKPAEGTKLEAGEAVDITVSLGQTLVKLPDLDGLQQDEAEAILTFAGMKLGTVTNAYDAKTRSGIVMSHDAPVVEDGRLPKGSKVDLVISDGAKPRKVPADLEGKNALAVVKSLDEVSLKPVIENVQDPSVQLGYVVSVEPGSGTKVEFESEVKVRVSAPRDKAAVPDVSGKSTLQADADLREAGLNVLGIQGPAGNPVLRTIPAAGVEVSQGTAVRLVTE